MVIPDDGLYIEVDKSDGVSTAKLYLINLEQARENSVPKSGVLIRPQCARARGLPHSPLQAEQYYNITLLRPDLYFARLANLAGADALADDTAADEAANAAADDARAEHSEELLPASGDLGVRRVEHENHLDRARDEEIAHVARVVPRVAQLEQMDVRRDAEHQRDALVRRRRHETVLA